MAHKSTAEPSYDGLMKHKKGGNMTEQKNTGTSTRQLVRVNPHSSYRFCFLSTLQGVCGITTTNSSRLTNVSCVRIQQSSPPRSDVHDAAEATELPQETSDLK